MVAIAWKSNRDCPLCGRVIDVNVATMTLPTAAFPGLGKPYGDFLRESDPLQVCCGKRVHTACFGAWPERERFAAAFDEWMTGRLDGDPERGTAYRDHRLLVSAPCRPDDPAARIVALDRATTAIFWIRPADWPDALGGLPGGEALRPRFPTVKELFAAIDWSAKETACRLCMKKLGVIPVSIEAYRMPESEAWTLLDPARPMRQFLGVLVHAACYVAWPRRPLFAATLTDIRYRLAKLDGRGCPHADAGSVVLLDRDGDPEVTVRETGTTAAIPRDRWAAPVLPDDLRPFEREALAPALESIRARFPSVEALEGAVDWQEVERTRASLHETFLSRLRDLPIQARREGIRCPRCGRRVNDLQKRETEEAVGCVVCGAALTPLDFGWLP